MAKNNVPKMRVSFYISKSEYLQLRSLLVLREQSVSEWLRERIARFVKRQGND